MFFTALAALSGLVWGIGDFAGGKATQRAQALPVAWLSKLISVPLLTIYLLLTYRAPVPVSLGWGVLGGLAGFVGMILFYRALSAGAMAVAAPVTAVTSAAIPVVVGLARGEHPSTLQLVGVGCALVAIALVSLSPTPPGVHNVVTGRLVVASVGSGAGFALFFIFLAEAGAASGTSSLWPVAASQLSALALGAVLLVTRRPGGWPRGVALRWVLVAGPFDMTANVLFLVATRYGDLSLVAPLAALYPVTTVLLAVLVDRERLRPAQVVGLVLALLTLVLVNR